MSKKTRKKTSKLTVRGKTSVVKTAKTRKTKAAGSKTATKTSKRTPAKTAPRAAKAKAGKPAAAKPKTTRTGTTPKPREVTLAEGTAAPAFILPRDGGHSVSLADYAGRKLVVFFYPRADTPGCTLEAIAFSRLADDFEAAGTAILGVSADPVAKQDAFRDKHALTVPLASDETLDMLKAYGVWGEKSLYGKTFMGISRTTLLIDRDGKIARVWRHVKVDGHADQVLDAARNL